MNGSLAYKEEPRYEIIGGKVVMMASPSLYHILIGANIYQIFNQYLHGKKCTAIPDGAALHLVKGGERYEPDMMVVCDPEKIDWEKGVFGAPDLVVEILSPSTAQYDRGHKFRAYERCGVREYWIVSQKERSVEQYVLEDGRFLLWAVYTCFTKEQLADMEPEEREQVQTEFRCTLFDDLTIRMEDIFYHA